jgi:hypothetical protein
MARRREAASERPPITPKTPVPKALWPRLEDARRSAVGEPVVSDRLVRQWHRTAGRLGWTLPEVLAAVEHDAAYQDWRWRGAGRVAGRA